MDRRKKVSKLVKINKIFNSTNSTHIYSYQQIQKETSTKYRCSQAPTKAWSTSWRNSSRGTSQGNHHHDSNSFRKSHRKEWAAESFKPITLKSKDSSRYPHICSNHFCRTLSLLATSASHQQLLLCFRRFTQFYLHDMFCFDLVLFETFLLSYTYNKAFFFRSLSRVSTLLFF